MKKQPMGAVQPPPPPPPGPGLVVLRRATWREIAAGAAGVLAAVGAGAVGAVGAVLLAWGVIGAVGAAKEEARLRAILEAQARCEAEGGRAMVVRGEEQGEVVVVCVPRPAPRRST